MSKLRKSLEEEAILAFCDIADQFQVQHSPVSRNKKNHLTIVLDGVKASDWNQILNDDINVQNINQRLPKHLQIEKFTFTESKPMTSVFQVKKAPMIEFVITSILTGYLYNAEETLNNPEDTASKFNAESELQTWRDKDACKLLQNIFQFCKILPDKRICISCDNKKTTDDVITCQVGRFKGSEGQNLDFDDVYPAIFKLYQESGEERRTAEIPEDLFQKNVHNAASTDIRFRLFSHKWNKPCLWSNEEVKIHNHASFVMYNYARIVNILHRASQDYGLSCKHVSDLENAEWSLLKDEQEWELVFGYLFRYDEIVISSIRHWQIGRFQVHLIFQFLIDLSNVFSRYYKRVRIIKDANHLKDIFRLRIFMLGAIKTVYDHAFQLLNITPVHNM